MLWKYKSPIPKEIYINKDSMIIYEPKLEQAIYSTLKENLDILTLIKKAKFIKENHYIAELLGQKYYLFFEEGILKQISFVDAVGNSVEILFERNRLVRVVVCVEQCFYVTSKALALRFKFLYYITICSLSILTAIPRVERYPSFNKCRIVINIYIDFSYPISIAWY